MITLDSTLIAQIINFLILVFLLQRFAFKPVMKILRERQEKIAHSISSAEADEIKARDLMLQREKQLKQARMQAQEIVGKSVKRAQEENDNLLEEARRDIERMRQMAQEDIARERERAVAQLRKEMVVLSMQAATKIIAKNIDENANKELVDSFIEKLDKDKMGGLPC